MCRDVEFELFMMQTTHKEISLNALKEAELIFNNSSEQATIAQKNFLYNLEAMRLCQRELSRANIEIFSISVEQK